jgi:hypothetical protein
VSRWDGAIQPGADARFSTNKTGANQAAKLRCLRQPMIVSQQLPNPPIVELGAAVTFGAVNHHYRT